MLIRRKASEQPKRLSPLGVIKVMHTNLLEKTVMLAEVVNKLTVPPLSYPQIRLWQ